MANLMVISSNEQDTQLGRFVAENLNHRFYSTTSLVDVQNLLATHPDWLILYEGENAGLSQSLLDLLPKYVKPSKVFVATSHGFAKNPHLLKYPFYGHHLFRNFSLPAPTLFSRIFANSLYLKLRGLKPYFNPEDKVRTFQLTRSAHKHAAIEAIQNTVTAHQIAPRLAKSIAQGVDELMPSSTPPSTSSASATAIEPRGTRTSSWGRKSGFRSSSRSARAISASVLPTSSARSTDPSYLPR
jgi:hypothetical protein